LGGGLTMSRYFRNRKWTGLILGAFLIVSVFVTGADSWTPQQYDGQWQAYTTGWSYMWISSGNYAIWRNDAIGWGRFVYGYTNRQWFDGSWSAIGTSGASSAFMGDSAWHNLNNGWSYYYTTSGDYAVWKNNAIGLGRFTTAYGSKQWYDASWNPIGTSGASTAFMGDSAWHNLNNGWSYYYTTSGDYAVWKNNAIGLGRFITAYGPKQWYDSSWNPIGTSGASTAFIGDGAWHNLNNGWSYSYGASPDESYWSTNSSTRFCYQNGSGRWWNRGDYGNWYTLGPTNVSSAFIGDGAWHTLDSIWSYKFASDIGSLSGYVYAPSLSTGSWSWSTKLYTSSYASQVLGLYDSGNISSAFRYSYSAGSPYKWEDWNYYLSNKSAISQAIVFYTGSTAHSVSSWLSWLPVNPTAGNITRTETWDFRNNDWDNRFNHEVRAWANTKWVVQRAQGDVGNCGIIASIDLFEALSGLYGGYTKYWMDTAVANGWASSGGGSWANQNGQLLDYMADQFQVSMSWYYGTNTARSLSDLVSYVGQGQKVLIDIDLSYIPAFGSSGLHAVALVGDTYINGVHYAMITNGWNIQSNTTTIAGYDPNPAYPITYIEFSELESAYNAISSSNYTYVRIY
jgi:hypothetical protein